MKLYAIILLLIPVTIAGCATPPSHRAASYGFGKGGYSVSEMAIFPKGAFIWPVKGSVAVPFNAKVDKIRTKGIQIRADVGESVVAAKEGKVVFCHDHFRGFGKTVILDHGDGYQTVYAYNSEILVSMGDFVKRGDVIARAGASGRAKEASLYFEVRKNGQPQDPTDYLNGR